MCFLYMPLYNFMIDGMVFFIICWIRICYYLIIRWLIPNFALSMFMFTMMQIMFVM